MSEITIEISGPGGCIGEIMEVVKKALVNANVKTLMVVDEHPDPVPNKNLSLKRENVLLKANHCPWGG